MSSMGSLVFARSVIPDGSGSINVTRSKDNQLATTGTSENLQLNNCPNLLTEIRFDCINKFNWYRLNGIGFYCQKRYEITPPAQR